MKTIEDAKQEFYRLDHLIDAYLIDGTSVMGVIANTLEDINGVIKLANEIIDGQTSLKTEEEKVTQLESCSQKIRTIMTDTLTTEQQEELDLHNIE